MRSVKPNGHEELHVKKGLIFLSAHSEGMLGKAEFDVAEGTDITFNDVYVTYTDKNKVSQYRELNGWFIKVYVHEKTDPQPPKTLEERQMDIFEVLGGKS